MRLNKFLERSCQDAQPRLRSWEILRISVAYRGGSSRNPLTRIDHRLDMTSIGGRTPCRRARPAAAAPQHPAGLQPPEAILRSDSR